MFTDTILRQPRLTVSNSKHVKWLPALADGQQMLVIMWCVSETLQLNGVPEDGVNEHRNALEP